MLLEQPLLGTARHRWELRAELAPPCSHNLLATETPSPGTDVGQHFGATSWVCLERAQNLAESRGLSQPPPTQYTCALTQRSGFRRTKLQFLPPGGHLQGHCLSALRLSIFGSLSPICSPSVLGVGTGVEPRASHMPCPLPPPK